MKNLFIGQNLPMKRRLEWVKGSRNFNLFTPCWVRLLLDSFAFIFLLTGGAKLLNVWNDALLLQVQDPVFSFLRSGQLHAVAGLLEVGWGLAILRRGFSLCVLARGCAGLSSVFVAYRLAIALGDPGAYCGCLAGLDKLFGWSETQAERVSLGILGYVLLGSCGVLFWAAGFVSRKVSGQEGD